MFSINIGGVIKRSRVINVKIYQSETKELCQIK